MNKLIQKSLDWDTFIQEVHQAISGGEGEKAQSMLESLSRFEVPREKVLPVASLMRRTSLFSQAIKLLHAIVRPSQDRIALSHEATEWEWAEYAASLSYIGAGEEALAILEKINSKKVPEVLLFQAFARFSQWDYKGSLDGLRRYVEVPSLTSYTRAVGMINLCAALIHERHLEEAEGYLEELLPVCENNKWTLLYGNGWQLKAELALVRGQTVQARVSLEQAELILKRMNTVDLFYVHRWYPLVTLAAEGASETAKIRMTELRRHAQARNHAETLRDYDKQEAMSGKQMDLFWKVYFGTPFRQYRERFLKEYSAPLVVPKFYDWDLSGGDEKAETLDLFSGQRYKPLRAGSRVHRLLAILCSDFYRPLRVGTLFYHLYPQELFDPSSSPGRVHEAVRKLRELFESCDVPLSIQEKLGTYQIRANRPVRLRIPAELVGTAPLELSELMRLREKFAGRFFSAQEMAQALQVKPRTTLRLLKKGDATGVIQRIGKRRSCRYVFKA